MGVTAAQLIARVSVQGATEAKSELKSVGQAAGETSGGFKSMLGNALSFAAGQAVFNMVGQGVSFLKDQIVSTIQVAIAHQQVMAQTTQAIKSTGDASGMTAEAISGLADSLSQVTTFSDDTIQSGENLLLTFTGIGKQTFPMATQAMLDMSQAMGQDTKSSALMLGKALNDPTTGLSALTRVGVTFSDQEKEQIKTMMAHNDVAGAQAVMLKELETEFGNSAQAAGKTFGGQLQILGNRLDDAKQKIGTALLPVLQQLTGFVSSNIMPVVNNFSAWFTSVGLPAIQNFGNYISQNIVPAFQNAGTWISNFTSQTNAMQPVLVAVGAILAAVLIPMIWSFAAGVIAATWPVLAIGAAVAGLIAIFEHFYSTNSGFKSFIDGLVNGAKQFAGEIQANFMPAMQKVGGFLQANVLPILQQIGGFLVSTFMPVWQQLQSLWSGQIVPLMQQLWGALQPALPAFKMLGEIIGGIVVAAFGILVGIISGVVKALSGLLSGVVTVIGGIVQVFTGLVQFISGIVRFIYDLLTGNFSKLGSDLGAIWQGVLNMFGGIWQSIAGVFQAAAGVISGFVSGLVQGVIGFFQNLFDKLIGHSIIPDMINGIIGFFTSLPGKVFGAVEGFISGLISRFQGLWTTLKSDAANILGDIGNSVSNIFKGAINSLIDLINNIINQIDKISVNTPLGTIGFSIPDIPHLAAGTDNFAGGVALMGEYGPELAYLPPGTRVVPNNQISNALAPGIGGIGGGQSQPIIVNAVLQVDGRLMANGLMPHIAQAVRTATGVRF